MDVICCTGNIYFPSIADGNGIGKGGREPGREPGMNIVCVCMYVCMYAFQSLYSEGQR